MEYIYKSKYRDLVCGADIKVPLNNGRYITGVNFDNAATTPPFISVMEDINNFAPWYSSIHRGTGYKSRLSSKIYDDSREIILNFVGADINYDTVIYVKNTTEAINKLSNRLCIDEDKNVILSTEMEHHSNDLPWRDKFLVDYIEVDKCGRIDINDLKNKLIKYNGKVNLITIAGASNVTGYINPIHKAAKLAHAYGAEIMVDGAQLVPHGKIDMKPIDSDEHIDFLTFSAHKMYAPFGTGVLIGPKNVFKKGCPDYKGGGTVKVVTHDEIVWDDPPYKDEAGTPNLMGVVALTSAIRTLSSIGLENVEKYERKLRQYALLRLSDIPGIIIYCNEDKNDKVAIIPFNIEGIHHSKVAAILSYEARIAVRNGCFCAQPYIQRLLNISKDEMEKYINNPTVQRPGMVRLSFGLYNDFTEIDRLIVMLYNILQNKTYYNKKF